MQIVLNIKLILLEVFQRESVANYCKHFLNHVDNLELELEFLMKQKYTNSQLIGEIQTDSLDSKND